MNQTLTATVFLYLAVTASAQTVLNPGDDLANAVNGAAPGSTLLLNPGTYSLSTTLTVMKALTIKNNQATRPTIQVPAGTITTVHLWASNITLDGVNVSGGYWGIYAGDPVAVPAALSNIIIRNLTIDTNPSPINSGHGVLLRAVTNATVDNVTVVDAHANGIMVDEGSNNSVIVNNTVQSTVTQHAIAVKNSNGVTVAGNTITGSGFHGIILVGAQNGSVIRNSISGIKYDGITLDKDPGGRLSTGNYIGNNTIVSTTRQNGVLEGTGIWLNSESNGTLVYANSTTGAPENGLTVFNASNNHFMGNVTWDNSQGGIFIYGPSGLSYSVGPQPAYTVVQGNYTYSLPVNAGINLLQSSNSTVFDNFVQATPGSTTTGGIFLQATSNNQVFHNTLNNLQIGLRANADAASSSYFLNRHLTAMQTFIFSPATVTPDGGSVYGGNYWAGHNAGAPYTNIIYNLSGAINGPYKDQYPYQSDTLNQQPYVTVLYPTSGTVASIGSQKTIEWRSGGCTYVDIFYRSSGTNISIANNYPDVGFYRWTVPNLTQAAGYTIYIDCKNSANQSLGVNSQSGAFTIAKAGIELLTPQGNERLSAGEQAAVAWKRTAAVTAVDVLYRSGSGAFTTVLASGVAADSTTVTVPATATSQGSFLVRASNDTAIADSTDGYVNIRSAAAPQVTALAGPLQIGTLHQVDWTSPTTSLYVDVEYWDTTANTFRVLVQNLPDFGRFTFLVPDKVMTSTYLRVRFKASAATTITTANSGLFNTTAATGGGGGTTPATPGTVSVAPASGSGSSATFSAVYSDANGGADISLAYILVNSSINAAGGCFIEYNGVSNTYRLINDAGTTWSGAITAGQTAQNSQCAIAPSGTTSAVSGSNLTVNFPITFKPAFAGAKSVYLLTTDAGGANSGWQARGAWTVTGSTPGPVTGEPSVVSFSPLSGSATANTFTATYSHPSGVNGHYLGYMLFLPTPNVVNYVATGSCLVEYNRISTGMRLIDNAGTGWLGGQSGVNIGTPGATLENNHCTLNIAQSSASISGNTMTVNAVVTFKPGFTGVLGTFLQELDVNGVWTGMTQFGNWVAYTAATPKPGPYIVSGAPATGAGSSTTYTITTGHTNGITALNMVHLLINTQIVGGSPCQIVFFPGGNHVVLINSAGTDLIPGFITPGSNTGTLTNGRCTVSGNGMTRSNAGNNVTINLPVSFNTGTFGGAKRAYVNTFDNSGFLTHWQQLGTWTVQ